MEETFEGKFEKAESFLSIAALGKPFAAFDRFSQ